jgi:hypothetical protein
MGNQSSHVGHRHPAHSYYSVEYLTGSGHGHPSSIGVDSMHHYIQNNSTCTGNEYSSSTGGSVWENGATVGVGCLETSPFINETNTPLYQTEGSYFSLNRLEENLKFSKPPPSLPPQHLNYNIELIPVNNPCLIPNLHNRAAEIAANRPHHPYSATRQHRNHLLHHQNKNLQNYYLSRSNSNRAHEYSSQGQSVEESQKTSIANLPITLSTYESIKDDKSTSSCTNMTSAATESGGDINRSRELLQQSAPLPQPHKNTRSKKILISTESTNKILSSAACFSTSLAGINLNTNNNNIGSPCSLNRSIQSAYSKESPGLNSSNNMKEKVLDHNKKQEENINLKLEEPEENFEDGNGSGDEITRSLLGAPIDMSTLIGSARQFTSSGGDGYYTNDNKN